MAPAKAAAGQIPFPFSCRGLGSSCAPVTRRPFSASIPPNPSAGKRPAGRPGKRPVVRPAPAGRGRRWALAWPAGSWLSINSHLCARLSAPSHSLSLAGVQGGARPVPNLGRKQSQPATGASAAQAARHAREAVLCPRTLFRPPRPGRKWRWDLRCPPPPLALGSDVAQKACRGWGRGWAAQRNLYKLATSVYASPRPGRGGAGGGTLSWEQGKKSKRIA